MRNQYRAKESKNIHEVLIKHPEWKKHIEENILPIIEKKQGNRNHKIYIETRKDCFNKEYKALCVQGNEYQRVFTIGINFW